jgi:hypothetical protein
MLLKRGSRKKSICGVAQQLRRWGAPESAPHSPAFARLASGAFCETIIPLTFYEIIKKGVQGFEDSRG